MYYVYKITNSINDKVYVGRTIRSIEQRYKEHLQSLENGDTRHLYSAMRKYGANNFKIELIEECSTLDEMIEKEAYYCELLEAYTKGYNMTTADEINPMECEKAKASHRRKMQSNEVKSKISETMHNKRISENKLTMHKDNLEKRIPFNNVSYYIQNGWKQGNKYASDPFYDGIHVRVYSKTEIKNILPDELEYYKNQGWKLSPSSANNYINKKNNNPIKIKHNLEGKRIRIYKDNHEKTVCEFELDLFLQQGWSKGGKPGRMTEYQKQKLAASHKGMFDEKFKQEQSTRLKEFYKNNPDYETKSKKKVRIINLKNSEQLDFNSCLDFCINTDIPEWVAKSGVVNKWVKAGYITRKSSKYYQWKIFYIE